MFIVVMVGFRTIVESVLVGSTVKDVKVEVWFRVKVTSIGSGRSEGFKTGRQY